MRTTVLKREQEFLRITNDREIFYGGDQAWFGFTVGIHGGCGTVAAANVTAYLAGVGGGLNALYEPDSCRKSLFCRHMDAMYPYVKPWKIPFADINRKPYKTFGWTLGVWPAGRLRRGVERFAAGRGVCLRGIQMCSRKPLEKLVLFIQNSLERDCPVAMLIGKHPDYSRERVTRPDGVFWTQTTFARHWVVITAMGTEPDGTVLLKVSTWGGYAWLNLNRWQEAGDWVAGLVSFTWEV